MGCAGIRVRGGTVSASARFHEVRHYAEIVQSPPADPPPDTKDWTWTLSRRCDQCGFAAGEVEASEIAERAFIAAEEWVQILRSSPAVASRPAPTVWSPLEYGCHVRDVFRLFDDRLALVLAEEHPTFANWDQDEAAIVGRYHAEDPEVVAEEIEALIQVFVVRIQSLTPAQFGRRGTRSNGDEFDIISLLRYCLHDVIHHLWDVTGQQDGAASLALE